MCSKTNSKHSKMHFSQKTGFCIAVIVCVAVTGTYGQDQKSTCCTEVSSKNITATITGFQVQRRNPPCVKAVIFLTTEGLRCSHWKESWVMEKVRELRELQAASKGLKINSTTVTPQTTGSA